MAVGSGSNEIINIGVNARQDGIESVISSLNELQKKLIETQKILNKRIESGTLQADLNKLVDQYNNLATGAAKAGTNYAKSVDKIVKETEKLQKTAKKGSFGFQGNIRDAKEFAKFEKQMEAIGQPIVGNPKDFATLFRNLRDVRKDLGDASRAGIATKDSIRALSGETTTFLEGLTKKQQNRVFFQTMRKEFDGYLDHMRSRAKDTQWIGRQMMEGISFPIAGIATVAVRSFMSVQSEMIQLKKVTEFGANQADAEAYYSTLTSGIKDITKEFGTSHKAATALYKEVAALGIDGADQIKEFATAVSEVALVGGMNTDTAMNFFRTMNAIFAEADTTAEGIAETTDLMAQMSAVADETALQLTDLAQAFPEVAPVMKQMGFSAAGVAGALAGMYKRGIPATEAAHGLKFALQRLVSPTKDANEIIQKVGFSLFDASGKAKVADLQIFQMAQSLGIMTDEAKSKALGELFGLRQAARMQSFFDDVEQGRKQLEKYTKTGGDLSEVTSDYARSLIAAGAVAGASAKPIDRYNKALEEIKKDPTVGLKRLKAAFEEVKIAIGAAIAPALISAGEVLVSLLQKLTEMPKGFQVMILSAGALVAALGPMVYILAQARHALVTLGKVGISFLPKMVDVTSNIVEGAVKAGPGDVGQLGGRFFGLQKGFIDKMRFKFGLASRGAAKESGKIAASAAETTANEGLATSNNIVAVSETKVAAAVTASTNAMRARSLETIKATIAQQTMGKERRAINAATEAATAAIDLPRTSVLPADLRNRPPTTVKDMARRAAQQVDDVTPKKGILKRAFSDFGKDSGSVRSQFRELGVILGANILNPIKSASARSMALIKGVAVSAKSSKIGTAVSAAGSKVGAGAATTMGILTGSKKVASGGIGTLLSLFMKFNYVTFILAAVAAAVMVVIMAVRGFKSHWERIVQAVQPAIERLKQAFQTLKDAFTETFSKMGKIVGQLGGSANEGQKTAQTVDGIGAIFAKVVDIIAGAVKFAASVIQWLWPYFEHTAYIVKNIVGFVSALFQGNWKQAWDYFVAVVYSVMRPVLMVLDTVAKGIAQYYSSIINMIVSLASKIPGLGGVAKGLKGVAEAAEGFSDRGFIPALDEKFRDGMGGIFSAAPAKVKPKVNEAGKKTGEDFSDALNDGAASSSGGGESWVKSWIDKVVGQIDKQLDKLRQSAVKALEKAQETILKAYDARIKAIEDTEKAEEKLLKTEEYIAKRRDLLRQKEINAINYRNNREKLLYEGKINEVRILDLEQRKSSDDINKQISDLDTSRARDLLKEQRDLLKEQINAEKDAAQERFNIQKEYLELYLDELYKMTPVTVEQFQTMMDQINGVLEASGAKWPEYATTAMDNMRNALNDANKEIINEFNRTENNPLLQWVTAFAEPAVVDILKKGLSAATGGGGGGMGGGEGGELPGEVGAGESPASAQSRYDKFGAGASDEAQQAIIDSLKYQIQLGDDRSKQHELYDIAYKQYIIDRTKGDQIAFTTEEAAQSLREKGFRFYKEGSTQITKLIDENGKLIEMHSKVASDIWVQNNEEMHEKYRQINEQMTSSSYTFTSKSIENTKKISDSVDIYTDNIGQVWTMVNGKLTSGWGDTAEFIKDKNGNITNSIISSSGVVRSTTKATFADAQKLLDEMINKNYVGTEAGIAYIREINNLGYAVKTLPDGKQIIIEAETSRAIARLKALAGGLNKMGANLQIDDIFLYGQGREPIAQMEGVFPGIGGYYLRTMDGKYEFLQPYEMASGGIVKSQKDGVVARIAEGGYDEFVITTDPKYRAANIGYLAAAASKMGIKMAAGAAVSSSSRSMPSFSQSGSGSSEYGGGSGDVYINVDTFIGEEQWFAEMAKKYNMKTIPRERKVVGQQRRVVSSYNNRWDVK